MQRSVVLREARVGLGDIRTKAAPHVPRGRSARQHRSCCSSQIPRGWGEQRPPQPPLPGRQDDILLDRRLLRRLRRQGIAPPKKRIAPHRKEKNKAPETQGAEIKIPSHASVVGANSRASQTRLPHRYLAQYQPSTKPSYRHPKPNVPRLCLLRPTNRRRQDPRQKPAAAGLGAPPVASTSPHPRQRAGGRLYRRTPTPASSGA